MLAESELQVALERAEQAEQALKDLKSNGNGMTNRPPCAPPPPPPPPMPPMLGGCNPPIKRPSTQGHRPTEGDSLEDMARLLGIQRTPKPPPQQAGTTSQKTSKNFFTSFQNFLGAIDNIINEIKGGKFTLKATEVSLENISRFSKFFCLESASQKRRTAARCAGNAQHNWDPEKKTSP